MRQGTSKKANVASTHFRIGMGYDIHPLGVGRKLILGGVEIPHDKGLLGHSDADALVHAVCDALLGAMGEGDLGRHFPSSDQRYKNISSLKLLKEVAGLLERRGYRLVNIDSTIIAQAPRLAPHLAAIGFAADCRSGLVRSTKSYTPSYLAHQRFCKFKQSLCRSVKLLAVRSPELLVIKKRHFGPVCDFGYRFRQIRHFHWRTTWNMLNFANLAYYVIIKKA